MKIQFTPLVALTLFLLAPLSPVVVGDVFFDMVPEPTDFTRDSSNPEHSGTLARDGITALFTAQGDEGLFVPLGDLHFSGDSFGMSIADGQNVEHLIDVSQSDTFGDIHEQIVVSFDQQVRLDEIVLDTFGVGDGALLSWGTGSVSLGGTSSLTDIYDLTSAGIVLTPSDAFTITHVSGDGFSFESFRVTSVPEPGSVAVLALAGLVLGLRRRRV